MKFDIEGRVRNMRLPDGKTALLFSVYEAVSNSIYAIEERLTLPKVASDGFIAINITFDGDSKCIKTLSVRDNGIGLNDRHLRSFETCDTREKASVGGRGVGRLVWLKVFDQINVESAYQTEAGTVEKVEFEFCPTRDDSLVNIARAAGTSSEIGTRVTLIASDPGDDLKMTVTLLARQLSHHFFPYFIAGSMPRLTITQKGRTVDVGNYLSSRMDVKGTETIDLTEQELGTLTITHAYVDPKIARELANSILLTAQGRVVASIEIEKKFALKELEGRRAYACVVRSDFLDDKADQERTSFKVHEHQLEAIKQAALDSATSFLGEHIRRIRITQKRIVVDLLEEHPQLALSVDDVEGYVQKLSPSMSDEDIGKTLFTLLYRHEKRVRAQIKELGSEDSPISENREAVNTLLQKVGEDAKRRLAEYTIKRHQIIQIAKSMLRYSDEEKRNYELEKTVHQLICPMGKMLHGKEYDQHNLWLIDDLLSYYAFFASDKTLKSLGVEGDGERKEPDLLFFNPFGFRREGTNDPVVIVEFKRPGDETPSSDPVDQVLGYIEKLRDKTIKDVDGEVISDIGDDTPFECIIICDLTKGARARIERSVAQNPTPDGLGYYGFSQRHKASIRVLSYKKVFRDAELRNHSFFEKLGLLPGDVKKAIAKTMAAE